MRVLVILISLVYLGALGCLTGAELLYRRGTEARDVSMLKTAQRLNPFVSKYFYAEYEMTHDIKPLVHAIRLQPTKPAYHMYYGLALLKQSERTRASDGRGVSEICRGAGLKPYSKAYTDACRVYKASIPVAVP